MSNLLRRRAARAASVATHRVQFAVRPIIETLEHRWLLSVATVNTAVDGASPDSVLTLREAIQVTNGDLAYSALTPQEQAQVDLTEPLGTNDTIRFNISGAGVHTILLSGSQLPTITKKVFVDGYSQPGSSKNTLATGNDAVINIVIDGSSLSGSARGIGIFGGTADGSKVQGLSIVGFAAGEGISMGKTNDNVISGNFIGVKPDGVTVAANSSGIGISQASTNTIGGSAVGDRNLISGNTGDGIYIQATGANDNHVVGNYIGTDASGTAALANGDDGVDIEHGANTVQSNLISGNTGNGVYLHDPVTLNTVIQGNYIGVDVSGNNDLGNDKEGIFIAQDAGSAVIRGNVISGNGSSGITHDSFVGGDTIAGNFIGTNAAGTAAIANDSGGIYIIFGGDNVIGGTTAADRNIISGNQYDGVTLDVGSSGNQVSGNYIGTNAAGTAAIANGTGVNLSQANDNIIGGLAAGAGNLISGNTHNGINLGSSGNGNQGTVVYGNFIGTAADGATALGNGDNGIYSESRAILIGSIVTGGGNTIAFNKLAGVAIDGEQTYTGVNNAVRGNSIFGNGKLGIDLQPVGVVGVTANDPGDTDSYANGGQNFPVLTSATTAGSTLTVNGLLNSEANQFYVIDFYANDAIDLTGLGEGKRYLGSISVQTDASGNATFTATLTATLGADKYISATATTTANAPYGDTSEFSQTIEATNPAPPPPVITISDVSKNEGNSGTTAFTFTVTRTGGTSGTSDLYYQTVSGTATASTDYTTVALTPLHFAAGEASKQIAVQVKGDTAIESDETFFVKLSSPVGATLGDDTGLGTIVNDDLPAAPSAIGYTNLKARKNKNNRYDFSGVVASFTSTVFNSAGNFTATINWGDSQSSAGSIAWNKKTKRWDVSGLHQYVNRGTYHLVITITDTNGRTATANSTLTA